MTLMVFVFLCFAGLLVMFFHMMRVQEKFQESMRTDHAQLRLMLRNLEARLAETSPQEPTLPPVHQGPPESLSLSQPPQEAPVDNGLELRFDTQERR